MYTKKYGVHTCAGQLPLGMGPALSVGVLTVLWIFLLLADVIANSFLVRDGPLCLLAFLCAGTAQFLLSRVSPLPLLSLPAPSYVSPGSPPLSYLSIHPPFRLHICRGFFSFLMMPQGLAVPGIPALCIIIRVSWSSFPVAYGFLVKPGAFIGRYVDPS